MWKVKVDERIEHPFGNIHNIIPFLNNFDKKKKSIFESS